MKKFILTAFTATSLLLSSSPIFAAPKVQTYMEGKQIRKVIVVPERLVNIVCG